MSKQESRREENCVLAQGTKLQTNVFGNEEHDYSSFPLCLNFEKTVNVHKTFKTKVYQVFSHIHLPPWP